MKRPLFDVGISVLLGSAAVLYGGPAFYALIPVLMLAALLCSVRASSPFWRKAAVCLLSGAAAMLFMLGSVLSVRAQYQPLDGSDGFASGVVTEKRNGNLYEVYGSIETETGSAENIKFTLWSYLADELEAGDSFCCPVRVSFDDPYTSEYRSSAGESRFLFCSTSEPITRNAEPEYPLRAAVARLRAEASQRLIRALGSRTGALYSAVTTGLRPGFDELTQSMKDAGIYHVLAISGLHISVFCHIVTALAGVLPVCRWLRSALALALLWCPVLLSGGSHAVLRAAVMYSVMLFGQIIGRKADSLNSLGLAVLILIFLDPFAALSYGFLLTVLATMGILLYERPLSEFLLRKLPLESLGRAGMTVVHLICCSAAAQALTFPILADMDARLVLNGIPASVVILPLMTPLLFFGYLLVPVLFVLPEGVTAVLLVPARLLGELFLWLSRLLAELPFILPLSTPMIRLTVLLLEGLLVLLTVLPAARRWFAPAALAGVSLCGLLIAGERWLLADSVLVVSRGEDFLLSRNGHAVVLLSDPDSGMLEELRRCGVEQVDLMIVEDYEPLLCEGTLELLEEFPPEYLAVSGDHAAVRSYLESVCSSPAQDREEVIVRLSDGVELTYQSEAGMELEAGTILLLKFSDGYDIINEYEPDVLLAAGQKAVFPAGDSGIQVRENSEERVELVIWPEGGN